MSNKPVAINSLPVEIFIKPGETYFGGGNIRLRTLLGSCISLVFWHRQKKLGGMCHFMLPTRNRAAPATGELDGRYADEAMQLLLRQMYEHKTRPADYTVKLIGGGNMFPAIKSANKNGIGLSNIDAARRIVNAYNFNCNLEHLDGNGYRQVIFDVPSGDVWIKHQQVDSPRLASINGLA